jgi:hypothetical protein
LTECFVLNFYYKEGQSSKSQQSFKVYEEPGLTSTPSRVEHSTQCPEEAEECWCSCHERAAEREAYELMVQEEPPPYYWKQLAERQEEELNQTLEEKLQVLYILNA